MKITKLEVAGIAIALVFIGFTGGYFIGRSSIHGVFTVETEHALTQPATPTPAAAAGKSPSATVNGTAGTSSPLPSETAAAGIDGKININTATAQDLSALPGIGDVIAKRIVDYRAQYGAFQVIEEIENVKGIGEKIFSQIKDYITV